jgi:hypothetical protein
VKPAFATVLSVIAAASLVVIAYGSVEITLVYTVKAF